MLNEKEKWRKQGMITKAYFDSNCRIKNQTRLCVHPKLFVYGPFFIVTKARNLWFLFPLVLSLSSRQHHYLSENIAQYLFLNERKKEPQILRLTHFHEL